MGDLGVLDVLLAVAPMLILVVAWFAFMRIFTGRGSAHQRQVALIERQVAALERIADALEKRAS